MTADGCVHASSVNLDQCNAWCSWEKNTRMVSTSDNAMKTTLPTDANTSLHHATNNNYLMLLTSSMWVRWCLERSDEFENDF